MNVTGRLPNVTRKKKRRSVALRHRLTGAMPFGEGPLAELLSYQGAFFKCLIKLDVDSTYFAFSDSFVWDLLSEDLNQSF